MSIKLMGEDDLSLAGVYPKDVKRGVRFVCATSGLLTNIEFEALGNSNVKFAIYSNKAGDVPDALLAYASGYAFTTGYPNWATLDTPLPILSGTVYWIFFNSDANCVAYADIGGTNKTMFYSSTYATAWPDSMGAISNDTAINSFQLAGWGTTGGRFQVFVL